MSCILSYCADCIHLWEYNGDGPHCDAFKNKEIPKEIFWRKDRKIKDCSDGIGFESKD